jgi:hypothetical protein
MNSMEQVRLWKFFAFFSKKKEFFSLQEILQIEAYSRQFYEPQNGLQQKEAEKALIHFADSPDVLQKCTVLLERGQVGRFQGSSSFFLSFYFFPVPIFDYFGSQHTDEAVYQTAVTSTQSENRYS